MRCFAGFLCLVQRPGGKPAVLLIVLVLYLQHVDAYRGQGHDLLRRVSKRP